MPPGLLPWIILGGLGMAVIPGTAFRPALSRTTTQEARAAAIRAFAISALLPAPALAWAWSTTSGLAALLDDPDRDRHALADLLIEPICCVLWLCL